MLCRARNAAIGPGTSGAEAFQLFAREAIQQGELVCIFAEGQISRTGQLQPFQRGMMRIVEGTGAPIIPVYLDELWGSIFSYSGGRFFWKWPSQIFYPVTVSFGAPMTGDFASVTRNLGAYVAAATPNPAVNNLGTLAGVFAEYPGIGKLLPAMGYSPMQIKDLESTINASDADLLVDVLIGDLGERGESHTEDEKAGECPEEFLHGELGVATSSSPTASPRITRKHLRRARCRASVSSPRRGCVQHRAGPVPPPGRSRGACATVSRWKHCATSEAPPT